MNSTVQDIQRALTAAGKTVAVAESISAGKLQDALASVSGSSDFFQGGITAYQRAVKVDALGVNNELARKTNCVALDIARQMARGALKLFAADFAISTCGYAELEGEAPYAFIAIASPDGTVDFAERLALAGDRETARRETAERALERFAELVADELGERVE